MINRGPVSSNDSDSIGVYALDSVSLTDRLILNLGVRWDQYGVEGVNGTAATIGGFTQSGGVWNPATYVPVARSEWEFVNYQVGLVFKPTSDSSVSTAKRGMRPTIDRTRSGKCRPSGRWRTSWKKPSSRLQRASPSSPRFDMARQM